MSTFKRLSGVQPPPELSVQRGFSCRVPVFCGSSGRSLWALARFRTFLPSLEPYGWILGSKGPVFAALPRHRITLDHQKPQSQWVLEISFSSSSHPARTDWPTKTSG